MIQNRLPAIHPGEFLFETTAAIEPSEHAIEGVDQAADLVSRMPVRTQRVVA